MADSKMSARKPSGHVGVVLAAVAAIAAGVYLFATKQGKRQRVTLQDWVMKAERDVLKRLQGVGEVNQEAYEAIVDAVLVNYQKAKKINSKALEELREELNRHWAGIERNAKRAVTKTKKVVREAIE